MSAPAVRPAGIDDVAGIRAVIASTGLFPPHLIDAMIAPALAGAAADDLWFVADDGAVAGVAFCQPERMTTGTWNALLLAVAAPKQGRGVGAQLMATLETTVAARGAHLLLVETSGLDAFAATRRFYEGIGYMREARVRDFYAPGEDKVVFRKALGE